MLHCSHIAVQLNAKLLLSYCRHEAVIQCLVGKENGVFDEDRTCSQDEGGKQVYVDVVPGAVELPVGKGSQIMITGERHTHTHTQTHTHPDTHTQTHTQLKRLLKNMYACS